MRAVKAFMAVVAAGCLTLGAGTVFAAEKAAKAPASPPQATAPAAKKAVFHRVRGEVTAVEPGAKTLVVKAMRGKEDVTVGVDVTDQTMIREGKAHKTLTDIKVGDRVWMKYERASNGWVADTIRILKPAHVAAKQ